MNREIKFRGKRIDNCEWVEGYYAWSMGKHYITYVYNEYPTLQDPGGCYIENTYEVDGETVGQFIGQIDKNGKEIYEGDCDKAGNVVVFLGGSYCLNGDRLIDANFEIAGNIYETPNLLP